MVPGSPAPRLPRLRRQGPRCPPCPCSPLWRGSRVAQQFKNPRASQALGEAVSYRADRRRWKNWRWKTQRRCIVRLFAALRDSLCGGSGRRPVDRERGPRSTCGGPWGGAPPGCQPPWARQSNTGEKVGAAQPEISLRVRLPWLARSESCGTMA